MKALITASGQFGPFHNIETLADRYRCDGVEYQFGVIGAATIGTWTPPPPDPAIEAARLAGIEADRIASLWQAAHDYEYAQVSGSAIGLLAMGVMQAKPKCIAVQGWIRNIWAEYYARKFSTSTDYSFAVIGPCPHSVPELMVELGL